MTGPSREAVLARRLNRALISWPAGATLDHVEVQYRAALPGETEWQFTNPLAQLVARGYATPVGGPKSVVLLRGHVLTTAGERHRTKLRALVGLGSASSGSGARGR